MTILCDYVLEARTPDIVVAEEKNNKAIIVDIVLPWDHIVYEKEEERIEKYQNMKRYWINQTSESGTSFCWCM